MRLLRIEPMEGWPKVYALQLEFDPNLGTLTGTVGAEGYGISDLILDVDIDLTKWVGKIAEARIVMTDVGYELIVIDALKNYSIGNGMPDTPERRSATRHRVFRIFVKENLEDSLIQVLKAHEEMEGFENIVEDGDPSLRMYNFVRRDADLKKLLSLSRLKCDMLGVVDQRDSVSYLEAQVDILTRLVLALHPGDDSTLINILRKADEHSVLNIKGTDALAKEFTAKKAWVRTVQKDYYESKKALEATPAEAGDEVQPELPSLPSGDEELL